MHAQGLSLPCPTTPWRRRITAALQIAEWCGARRFPSVATGPRHLEKRIAARYVQTGPAHPGTDSRTCAGNFKEPNFTKVDERTYDRLEDYVDNA
jgi:hypothetical protein